jgi:hypothetical protein
MKLFYLVLIIFSSLAVADNDGNFESNISAGVQNPGSDAISLTLVNDWTLTGKALGLDVFFTTSGAIILGVDNVNNIVQAYNSTGSPMTALHLNPSNGSCFGVTWNNDVMNDFYLTNDWGNDSLFHTENFGGTWTYFTNPAGTNGRGMDFDGTDYWESGGMGGGVWRFTPGGAQEHISLSEPPTTISGITVFQNGSNTCLAVTCYSTPNIYFYDWDGSAMTYLGSAPCPAAGVGSSLGLAYSGYNANIYWSYRDSSDAYHLTEFSFSLTSLARSSWGAIKTSF